MIPITIVQTAFPFFAAIIALWIATLAMRRTGIMWPYFPLVLLAAASCSVAALQYYQLLLTVWQALLALEYFVAQVWVLVVIIVLTKKQS